MILLLDNFDSFTYNLRDYFAQLGVECVVYRNDVNPKEIFKNRYRGVVLSPGPGKAGLSGCLMEVIHYYAKTHPLLGICLGHQGIGEYFGAELRKAEIPMHGKISVISQADDLLFQGMQDKFQVVRYHSLVLSNIPPVLKITARTEKGEVMAIRHIHLPIHGLQFHPEAILTENGLQMLHNWIRFYNIAD